MRRALAHSQEVSKRELRAYVGVVLDPTIANSNSPRRGFRVLMENCGKTPAYKIKLALSWWPFEGANVARAKEAKAKKAALKPA